MFKRVSEIRGVIKNKNNEVFVLFILAILTVFALFSSVDLSSLEKHFFNSDTLYQPSIYKDVFIDYNNFSDFNFNPAPNFFPDMGLHFLLMNLFNANFKWVAFIFSILQLFSILFLLNKIGAFLVQKNNYVSYLGLCLLIFFFLPSLVSNDFLFSFYFVINSYHLGSFVMSLVLLLLVRKELISKGLFNSVMIVLLTFLTYVSDKSIVINFILPTLISLFIFYFFNKEKDVVSVWRVIFLIVLGTVIGVFFLFLNSYFEWLLIATTDIDFNFHNSWNSIVYFCTETIKYVAQFSFVSLIILLTIVGYLSYALLVIRSLNKGIKLIDLQLFLMSTFILFTPVFIGKITGLDSMRYNYHGMILLVFLFPYLLNRYFSFSSYKFLKKITLIFFLVIVAFLAFKINVNGMSNYLRLYPSEVSSIDKEVEDLGLKNGLATYWKAKKITLFSQQNLKVYCVHEDLKVYRHVANNTWYYNDLVYKEKSPIYNFFICDNDLMKTNVLRLFPNAEIITISKSILILKTKEFTFNHDYEITLN